MKLENVADLYPLSPMQQGMLFHTVSDATPGVYVDQVVVSLQGPLDPERLVRSIRQVAAQFDALRTAFVWDGVDHPLQIVRQQVEFPVESLDWRSLSADQQQDRLLSLVADNKRQGFQLEVAPLLRFTLCQCDADCWKLVFCFHDLTEA